MVQRAALALYAQHGDTLTPLGGSGSRRSIIGQATAPVPSSPALLLERRSSIEVELVSEDFALTGSTPEGLADGANRALLGSEVIQFVRAVPLGGAQWRLEGLLRGRGGTERAALAGHDTGTSFVLLDHAPVALDPAKVGPSQGTSIVALGLADPSPVSDTITNPGITLRPLTPVHPRAGFDGGDLVLRWTRRVRGGWGWPDEVDLPLAEPAESYRVGLGPIHAPLLLWDVATAELTLDAAILAAHPGAQIWVRQIGGFALSDPLLLFTIP